MHTRKRVSKDVSRELVRAVRGQRLVGSYADDGNASALVALASYHRVVPQLHACLDMYGVTLPDTARHALHREMIQLTKQQLAAHATLDWLSGVLDNASWFLIKGPALGMTIYDKPELRTYNDLDVVMPPSVLAEGLQRLRSAGAIVHQRDWGHLIDARAGELTLMSPYGVTIDLHWRLHNDVAHRELRPVPIEDLLESARTLKIGNHNVKILRDSDALAHLAVHACGSGGAKLLWFLDIDHLIRNGKFDETDLQSRIRQHGAEIALAVAVGRAERLFGTPVPEQLKTQGPVVGLWRGATALSGRLDGPPRTLGGPSIDRLLCRSIRAKGWTSTKALLHKYAMVLRHRAPEKVHTEPSATLDDLVDAVSTSDEAW